MEGGGGRGIKRSEEREGLVKKPEEEEKWRKGIKARIKGVKSETELKYS